MIVRVFRSRYFGQYLALLIFAVLLRIDALLNPEMFAAAGSGFRNEFLASLDKSFPLIFGLLMLVLLLLQAFILNQVLENNRLVPLNQLLTAALYLTMMSSAVVLLQPGTMLLINLIMILLINTIFNFYGEQKVRTKAFDAGFLIGVASLLYFPAIWFLVFLWFSLIIFQSISFRTLIISFTGVTIPWLFAAFYFLWNDQLAEAFLKFTNNLLSISAFDFKFDPYIITIWALFFILFAIGYNEVMKRILSNAIEIRRKFRVLVFFFIFALLTAFWAGADLKFHLMLTLIPLSAMLSAYLSQTKKTLLPELIFALILITIFTGKVINLM